MLFLKFVLRHYRPYGLNTPDSMPTRDDEHLWWEVWLPTRGDRQGIVDQFKGMAAELGFRNTPGVLHFPERSVLLVYGSVGQMKRSMMTLNSIAELRRAKETAEFFDQLTPRRARDYRNRRLNSMDV